MDPSDTASPGLLWYRFDQGYFEDKPLWFKSLKPTAYGSTRGWVDLNQVGPGDTTPNTLPIGKKTYFSMLLKGYFVPKMTGVHLFSLASDDASYMWWGVHAITQTYDKTAGSASIVIPGTRDKTSSCSVALKLTAGTAYPLSIMYGQSVGAWHLHFQFTPPGLETPIVDGTDYLFNRVPKSTKVADMFFSSPNS